MYNFHITSFIVNKKIYNLNIHIYKIVQNTVCMYDFFMELSDGRNKS